MNNVRWTAAEDRVVLVLARGGVALRAALLQTHDFFQTKIPAARALTKIAADGAEISNLRGGNRMRGFGKAWKTATHHRMLLKLSQRDQRADSQSSFAVCCDPIESTN